MLLDYILCTLKLILVKLIIIDNYLRVEYVIVIHTHIINTLLRRKLDLDDGM